MKAPIFIGLWPCLFTTKLSYAQLFKWGHSNLRERQFKCDFCDSSFAERKTLREHKSTHIPIQERPVFFYCPHCDASYAHKRSLNRHLIKCNNWYCVRKIESFNSSQLNWNWYLLKNANKWKKNKLISRTSE
jgi:hypothetical protein